MHAPWFQPAYSQRAPARMQPTTLLLLLCLQFLLPPVVPMGRGEQGGVTGRGVADASSGGGSGVQGNCNSGGGTLSKGQGRGRPGKQRKTAEGVAGSEEILGEGDEDSSDAEGEGGDSAMQQLAAVAAAEADAAEAAAAGAVEPRRSNRKRNAPSYADQANLDDYVQSDDDTDRRRVTEVLGQSTEAAAAAAGAAGQGTGNTDRSGQQAAYGRSRGKERGKMVCIM